MDQDTAKHLLRQHQLTLEAAITICRAQKAAKKQCRSIQESLSESELAIRQKRQQLPLNQRQQLPQQHQQPTTPCPGCGSKLHKGGRAHCPAYDRVCCHCNKVGHFAKVCRTHQSWPPTQSLFANAMQASQEDTTTEPNHLSALRQVMAADPAPSTQIYISTLNGSAMAPVLPDSRADFSAAGPHLLTLLNEHPANLLPSQMSPHSASGHKMKPIGKSMKKLPAASWEHRQLNSNKLCRTLLQYRNTPSRRDGLSPAQKLFGLHVQTLYQHTATRFHQNGNILHRKQINKQLICYVSQRHPTHGHL